MEYEEIRYELSDHIVTLTLQRPQRLNAFTPRMFEELVDALDRIDADDECRVVVVTGAGRAFSAGADLGGGEGAFDYRDRVLADGVPADHGGVLALRMLECAKPLIAAVNGPAVGAGATFTLAMDVRLASDDARFGFVFTRRGIVPESCSSWLLPRIVGIGRAMEWVATGRVFPAQEALDAGLVLNTYPPGELLTAARGVAREIAENSSPVAVALSRRLLWSMLGARPRDAHRAESKAIFLRGQSADAKEGVSSFLEKRNPVFPDRVSSGLPDLGVSPA